jgi:hypothetical protein
MVISFPLPTLFSKKPLFYIALLISLINILISLEILIGFNGNGRKRDDVTFAIPEFNVTTFLCDLEKTRFTLEDAQRRKLSEARIAVLTAKAVAHENSLKPSKAPEYNKSTSSGGELWASLWGSTPAPEKKEEPKKASEPKKREERRSSIFPYTAISIASLTFMAGLFSQAYA